MARQVLALIALQAALSANPSPAATLVAGPNDYQQRVTALRPGDELVLRPGVYRQGLTLHGIHGLADHPIAISGAMGGKSAVLLARAGANTVSLADTSNVIIRDLWLDGRNLPVDAVKAERGQRGVYNITLERLTIVNHGAFQHTVAISTKCPAWGWVIRDSVIVGAGTGIYLGDSDGSAPFFDGVIEGNLIIDTIGYNLQVKHQTARPNLRGMPDGARVISIRNNIFAKVRNSSIGERARPNVLVGHFPVYGAGKDDQYEVTGNVFFSNPTEALFQGEGNLRLERNVFHTSTGDAVVVQPHHDVPRQVSIIGNFIVASGRGIRVTGGDPAAEQLVARNTIYASDPARGGRRLDNTTGSFEDGDPALVRALRSGTPVGRDTIAAPARRACTESLPPVHGRASPTASLGLLPVACGFMRSLEAKLGNG